LRRRDEDLDGRPLQPGGRRRRPRRRRAVAGRGRVDAAAVGAGAVAVGGPGLVPPAAPVPHGRLARPPLGVGPSGHRAPPDTGGSTATSSSSPTGSSPRAGSPFNHTRQFGSRAANAGA